jgi:4-hydroxybenzoate polyprenyltransferase
MVHESKSLIPAKPFSLKELLALLRVRQYTKNFFIFLPLFFAQKITEIPLLKKTFFGFVGFSLIASAVYIMNDYFDMAEDRIHEKKKTRPLASSAVPVYLALFIQVLILSCGLSIIAFQKMEALYLVLVYLAMNILYSLKLKHIALIDVIIIALGFIIRIFLGGIIGDIRLSMWIVVITFLLALFLAFSKRRDDILIFLKSGEKVRKVIDGYNLDFINISMTIMATVTLVSYIMYTVSQEVVEKVHSTNLYITSFFVLLGILRYLQIALVKNQSGSPTEILLNDKFLQLSILGWIFSFVIILYL